MSKNGGIIGRPNIPTRLIASGVWGLRENLQGQRDNVWPGPELVTNSLLISVDGNAFTVFNDGSNSVGLNLCSVVSGSTYSMEYTIIGSPSGSATLRIGFNPSLISPFTNISNIVGTYTISFEALSSGTLRIEPDNVGANFPIDFVSVKLA
jgi:hypothetical protein